MPNINDLASVDETVADDDLLALHNISKAANLRDQKLSITKLRDDAFLTRVNTWAADQRINALVGVNVAPSSAAQVNVVTGASTRRAIRAQGTSGQSVPVVEVLNNGGVVTNAMLAEGGQYRLANPAVWLQAASNDTVSSVGSARMACVSLRFAAGSGAAPVAVESSEITLAGGDVLARDTRRFVVMSGHVAWATSGFQSRVSSYGPQAVASDGSYVTITAINSVATGSGQTYTLEVLGTSGGTIRVRVTRTGGDTGAAEVHVNLLLAW